MPGSPDQSLFREPRTIRAIICPICYVTLYPFLVMTGPICSLPPTPTSPSGFSTGNDEDKNPYNPEKKSISLGTQNL